MQNSADAPDAEEPARHASGRVTGLIVAVLAACVAFQLNASMLSPALVTMARELDAKEATIGLSQTVFFTVAAMFSLFLPRLSDIVGRRKIMLWMLGLMLVGSVIAGLATNVEMLFAGRFLQGVCGPTVAIGLIMLRSEISDPSRYGVVLGLITAVNGGVAGIDSILGGELATAFGFRSIFFVIAGVAVIALVFVVFWGIESRPSAGAMMDWSGAVPLVIAVGAVLLGFTEASKLGNANWTLVALYAVVAASGFALFVYVERRAEQPLIDLPYLRQHAAWATLGTTVLTMAGIFAIANGLIPSLAQNRALGFDMNPDRVALVLLAPYALIGWLVGPFAGRLAPAVGYLTVLRAGMVGAIVVTILIALVGVRSEAGLIIGMLALGITYAGTVNIMLNGLGVVLSPPEAPGILPGLNSGAFNLGAGLGFVVLPAVQVAVGIDKLGGYTIPLMVGAALTVAALALSMFIPAPADAESRNRLRIAPKADRDAV